VAWGIFFFGCDLISYGLIQRPQWTACFEFKITSEIQNFTLLHVKDTINAYTILVGKPEGEKQLGSQKCNWEENTERNTKII
jgi:hypothetical protein